MIVAYVFAQGRSALPDASALFSGLPQRIVSLVPSQTELLHYLELDDRVVGITKFCIHPEAWFRSKKRIGGTKTVDMAKVAALHPDLIIGNKEENVRDQVEALSALCPVWISDVPNLDAALDMISTVGKLVGKRQKAEELCAAIEHSFQRLVPLTPKRRAAYFIWRKPWMAAGSGTFIDDMMQRCGLENVFGALERYPQLDALQIQEAQPELILLSSEPYPFAAKHFPELQEHCPGATIRCVDGELFSWYGSRLLLAPDYFHQLIRTV